MKLVQCLRQPITLPSLSKKQKGVMLILVLCNAVGMALLASSDVKHHRDISPLEKAKLTWQGLTTP